MTTTLGRHRGWLESKPGSASSLISLAMPDDWLEGLPRPPSRKITEPSRPSESMVDLTSAGHRQARRTDKSGLPPVSAGRSAKRRSQTPEFRFTFPLTAHPQLTGLNSVESKDTAAQTWPSPNQTRQHLPLKNMDQHVHLVDDDITKVASDRRAIRQQDRLQAVNKAISGPIRSSIDEKDMAVRNRLGRGRPQSVMKMPNWEDDGRTRPTTGPDGASFLAQFEARRQPLAHQQLTNRSQQPKLDPEPQKSNIIGYKEDFHSRRKLGTAERPMAAGPIRALNASMSSKDMADLLASKNGHFGGSKLANPPVVLFEDLDDKEEYSSASFGQDMARSKIAALTLKQARNGRGYTFGSFNAYPIELQTAMDIRNVLFGSIAKTFPPEWTQQRFIFSDLSNLKFGLVQEKGGPCGVLAAIQAITIKNLLFGSALHPRSDQSSPSCSSALTPYGATCSEFEPSSNERNSALMAAIAEALWRAAGPERKPVVVMPAGRVNFSSVGMYKSDGITETVAVIPMDSKNDMVSFLMDNCRVWVGPDSRHGVILFLYSLILSRGVPTIKEDMDSATNTLIAAHGYCTQDLVNLILTGKAVSNVFDNDVTLGDESSSSRLPAAKLSVIKLKGIHTKSDIGFLSLFEHYKSCQVGSNFKSPKYPIWVVCSESHYSVLFSVSKKLAGSEWQWGMKSQVFDLYYYDGLARQDHLIKLTIDVTATGSISTPTTKGKDLTPPLEHCIRTKWPDAKVDWNGSEPIL